MVVSFGWAKMPWPASAKGRGSGQRGEEVRIRKGDLHLGPRSGDLEGSGSSTTKRTNRGVYQEGEGTNAR